MSEQRSVDALQFERAEYAQPVAQVPACTRCKSAVHQSYYEVNGAIVCSACRERHEAERSSWFGVRFGRALVAGIGAAIAGSVLYWAVRSLTGYEIGIIAIAVGYGVGKAVNWGSRGRGGRFFQILAILLTYLSICGNYIPDIVSELVKRSETPAATSTAKSGQPAQVSSPAANPPTESKPTSFLSRVGALALACLALLALAAAAPFLAGFENIIGLFIIAIGLWEAWKLNRLRDDVISGPYQMTQGAAAPHV